MATEWGTRIDARSRRGLGKRSVIMAILRRIREAADIIFLTIFAVGMFAAMAIIIETKLP